MILKASIAAGLFALLMTQAVAQPPTASATFHHYHFRVGDPAGAMNYAATSLSGTRVLLRGLGVGVRVGAVHALFDRLDASDAAGTHEAEAAYAVSAEWLRSHGLSVTDDARNAASRAALAAMFRAELLDHVGFTASDLPAAVAALRSHDATMLRETADVAVFQPAQGVPIELLRDLDAPDAYWCPMHPDLRSSTPGKCPLCGMALVAIPPPRLGEYRMDIQPTAARGGGISRLRITFSEPDSGHRLSAFSTVHERLLHLFIIDRSLQYFRHVHPQPIGDGVFDLREPIPPGEYVVIADFLPKGGASQMVQRAIVAPGYTGPLFPAPPDLSNDTATERTVNGVRVKLDARSLKAGREGVLRFTLSDSTSGAPVTDLEPFLGAPGHMLIVNPDLTEADHVHPEEPAARGPSITFQPLPAAGGYYKLWLQFQRNGAVSTVPFVVSVEER